MSEDAPAPNRGNAGKGRPKGSSNKTTVAIKDAILRVYGDLQEKSGEEHGHFLKWANDNPTEFYKLAAKLLPIQVNADHSGNIRHEVVRRIVEAPK